MKALQGFCAFVYGVGFLGQGVLFLYVEWTYLRQSFVQMLNPLLHLQVVVTLLTLPLFWILLTGSILAYVAAAKIEKHLSASGTQSEDG